MPSFFPESPTWRTTGGRLLKPAPFLIAGIVNITPDSFSDGGAFFNTRTAVDHARRLLEDGAHMLDLGAESTRPGAEDIGHEAEWARLAPVLGPCLALRDGAGWGEGEEDIRKKEGEELRELRPLRLPEQGIESPAPPIRSGAEAPDARKPAGAGGRAGRSFTIAVDTFRAATAAAALGIGPGAIPGAGPVDVINDVSGGSFDPAIIDVVAQAKAGYVLGHSPARPDVMQKAPYYDDVVETLMRWFTTRMELLTKAGLPEECIALDPCIGFGKTVEHTAAVFRAVPRFMELGRPLYFGISRKSFIGAVTGQGAGEREVSTQAATALLARAGVPIHRVHNVADTAATLKLVHALYGIPYA